MATRRHNTKREALNALKRVTPRSFGAPNRKLRKQVWKNADGSWTSSVTLA